MKYGLEFRLQPIITKVIKDYYRLKAILQRMRQSAT